MSESEKFEGRGWGREWSAALSEVLSLGPFLRSASLMTVYTVIGKLQINNGKAVADGRGLPSIGSLQNGDPRMFACMNRDGRYIHPKRLPKTMR